MNENLLINAVRIAFEIGYHVAQGGYAAETTLNLKNDAFSWASELEISHTDPNYQRVMIEFCERKIAENYKLE